MAGARQKTGSGRIGVVGPVLAVLLAALGVLLIRDALIAFDVLPGTALLPASLDRLNGWTAEWWMVPAGVAAALLGLWLVETALRPRSRKTVPVTSATGLFLRTRDIARLASDAAEEVDGVVSATSTASRRAVTVAVRSTATAGIVDGVTDAVDRAAEHVGEAAAGQSPGTSAAPHPWGSQLMRRSVLGLDRFLAVVVGLCLVVVGAAVASWYTGWLADVWTATPKELSTAGAADVVEMSWWRWAAIGAGVLAVVLGLWWLIAHLPRRGVGMLVLPGSGKTGRLLVDPAGPASAAADTLADSRASAAHTRRSCATGESSSSRSPARSTRALDLSEVVAAADAVTTDLQAGLGHDHDRARVSCPSPAGRRGVPVAHPYVPVGPASDSAGTFVQDSMVGSPGIVLP